MAADPSTADAQRQLAALIRTGTVAAVDHAMARCRVTSGGLLTDWLPWFAGRAGDVRRWSPPSEGEQCMVLAPEGDTAAAWVLVGTFSDAMRAPGDSGSFERTVYPDGAVIEYDHESHALAVRLPAGGTAEITAPGSVVVHSDSITLNAPQTTTTGDLIVQGHLSYLAGMSGVGRGGKAAAVIQGSINVSEDVTAGNVSLAKHVHGGVRSGGESTSGPT